MIASAWRADRGACFGYIQQTLDHILLGDRIWLGRFTDEEIKPAGLDEQQYVEFEDLRAAREALDREIIRWVGSLDDETLQDDVSYHGIANPEQRHCPLWFALSHFFNHQTHHRGQVTTLLSQLGVDYGTTDLIAQPGYVSR